MAESPGASPDYIFPFMTFGRYDAANVQEFQYLMFRPLYWLGGPGSVTVNRRLSLARPPVFGNRDKTVRITLKHYRWSNGEPVDATDVLFWMNIWQQKPTGAAGWFPGGLSMPTSVTSVKITSPITITISFDRSFNPDWLLYNELSQITPLPMAWTTTSSSATAGSAGCATAKYGTDPSACKAVYDYLSEQSGFDPTKPTVVTSAPSFATNHLWKVVDGPWELTSFGRTSRVVFRPNPSYSGPNKPSIARFVEEPFTTASAEFDALEAGTIDVGYLPMTDVTSPAARAGAPGQPIRPGRNNPKLRAYSLAPSYSWGIDYFPYNFTSTGDTGEAGKIFRQLYVREAMQHLVDETRDIRRIYKGYAYPDYGPVPTLPTNPFASKAEAKNPYPYSVSAARSLLASHGWKVVKGGTTVCEKPGTGAGHCGAGITKDAKLSFTLEFMSGTKTLSDTMAALKQSWSIVGIHVSLDSPWSAPVVLKAVPCATGCPWELQNDSGGWTFAPHVYPTGEEIFASGAGGNAGLFTTGHTNALIEATTSSRAALAKYERYLEQVLPVVWQPEPVALAEVHQRLMGASPTSPLESLTPATYRWK